MLLGGLASQSAGPTSYLRLANFRLLHSIQVAELLPGRKLSYLTTIPVQNLELYWIDPRPGTP
jgi:hypothetical protein